MATALGRSALATSQLELLPKLQLSCLRLQCAAAGHKRAISSRPHLPRHNIPKYYKFHFRQTRTLFWSSNKDDDEVQQAEVLSERNGSPGFVPASSFPLRDVISRQRDQDLSAEELALKQALQQHQLLVDNNSQTTALDIKKSLEHLRDCFEALEYWEESFQVEQELEAHADSTLELAHCIFRQGKLCMRVGDVMPAHEKYQKALEMFQIEHTNNATSCYHADIGNVLVAMAGVHYQRQNADECLRVLEEAEPHFRKHGQSTTTTTTTETPVLQDPHPDLVKCLDNQGMIYRLKEDFYTALEKFEEALAVLGQSDFEKRQSLQLHIADMLSALDDVDSAIHYYHKILKEDKDRRKSDDETELDAVICHSIGVLYSQQRDLECAKDMLTKALELKQRFGGETNPDVASTLNTLGSVHGVLGNKRQALDCFQQALLIERMHTEDENDPQILHILRNISVLKGEKVPKWES